ncbi:MAG: heat-shock protein [Lysobacteraceae bacterium]|nr:MAG: heat-shock protein [Xanthomonadaceae bacterium]
MRVDKTKVKLATVVSLMMLLVASFAHAALPAAVAGQPLPSLAPILENVMPAVVNVHTRTRVQVRSPLLADPFFQRFFDMPSVPRERVSQSLGSGVIIDAEAGLVLTNNHVISGADEIFVTLTDGRSIRAENLGADPDTDVALIRIEADDLVALPIAADDLRVGDFVVAVGNPFGLGQTVTSGIVSALGRTGLQGLNYQNFIQTDASINPGNSGGALINLRGELVGINTAIFTPSGGNIGIGFAIPVEIATSVMAQLQEHGRVLRGSIGVQVQDLTPELANALGLDEERGAVVAAVDADSPAERAGLQSGDVIVALGRQQIQSRNDLLNAEGLIQLGQDVEMIVIRGGERQTVRVKIDKAQIDEMAGEEVDPRLRGAWLANVPTSATRESGIEGVWLQNVERRSLAWRYGLRSGDVIVAVNRNPIRNLSELMHSIEPDSAEVLLRIRRGRGAYLVLLD